MSLLNKLRSLPLDKRKKIALTTVVFLSGLGVLIWATTDFGVPKGGGLGTIREGAGEIATLIQNQADSYQQDRQALEENLQQVLKSAALVYPEDLIKEDEQPNGVLYLNNQFREKGLLVELKQMEFYSGASVAYLQVTYENYTQNPDLPSIYLDAATGSALAQSVGQTGSQITLQPLFQTGTPTEIKPGDVIDVFIVFGPVNGREKFDLVLGDFSYDLASDLGEHWTAKFYVDPQSILEDSSASESQSNTSTEPTNNSSAEPNN